MKWPKKRSGVSLIETMVAVLMLSIMGAGITAVFGFCTGTNKAQGEIATRTTECAQDKMEQLMALSFHDATSDTTQNPTAPTGGTGLGGFMTGNTTALEEYTCTIVLNNIPSPEARGAPERRSL